MFNQAQIVEINYNRRRYWFEVRRFDTETEFYAALIKDNLREVENVTAHTDCYHAALSEGECGRIYLLDKSIRAMAEQATHMALGILANDGLSTLAVTNGPAADDQQDLAKLVGQITAAMYSQSKYF